MPMAAAARSQAGVGILKVRVEAPGFDGVSGGSAFNGTGGFDFETGSEVRAVRVR
jgi:hypothetical protein